MNRHGRRPRFNTPLSEARARALAAVKRPLRALRPTTRFLIGFFALAVLSTLLLARTRSALTSAEVYQEGDVVRADVIAPADITFDDARQTEARREAARRETPPVWDYDPARIEAAVQSFRAYWLALKQQAESHHGAANANAPGSNAQRERAELTWPGEAADRRAVARAVAAHNFDPATLELLTHMMRDAGGGHVYDERDAAEVRPTLKVSDVRGGASEVLSAERARFVGVAAAREHLSGRVSELTLWSRSERELLASAVLPLIGPSVTFNRAATQAAREQAAQAVAPALVVLKRNQTVAREGDTVTPQMLGQFAAIRFYSHTERLPQLYIGLFIFACA
ncbi:MAG TPA: hypothetical protein VF611_15655, partial [Pyrinomonadaceae bacterium]